MTCGHHTTQDRTGLAELLREFSSCNCDFLRAIAWGICCEKKLKNVCLSSFLRKYSSKGPNICRKTFFTTSFATAKLEFHENFRSAGPLPWPEHPRQSSEEVNECTTAPPELVQNRLPLSLYWHLSIDLSIYKHTHIHFSLPPSLSLPLTPLLTSPMKTNICSRNCLEMGLFKGCTGSVAGANCLLSLQVDTETLQALPGLDWWRSNSRRRGKLMSLYFWNRKATLTR